MDKKDNENLNANIIFLILNTGFYLCFVNYLIQKIIELIA